jgi:hypothetical protein
MTAEELIFGLRTRFDEQFDVPVVVKIGKEFKHVSFSGVSQPSGRYAFEANDTSYFLTEALNPMALAYGRFGNNQAIMRLDKGEEKGIKAISEKRSYADKYNAVIPAVILELEA